MGESTASTFCRSCGSWRRNTPTSLVVIGRPCRQIHRRTGDRERARRVMRLGIDHPVVNDRFFRIWKSLRRERLAHHCAGRSAGLLHGQPARRDQLRRLRPGDRRGGRRASRPRATAARGRSRCSPRARTRPPARCAIRAKCWRPPPTASRAPVHRRQRPPSGHRPAPGGQRPCGRHEWIAGAGAQGAEDGPLSRGHASTGRRAWRWWAICLYVADSENHAIRAIDLTAGRVTHRGGHGRDRLCPGRRRGPGRSPLNSPWDLVWAGDTLYIAMAGRHQIWTYDRASDTVRPTRARAARRSATARVRDASLAQPTGLATDGTTALLHRQRGRRPCARPTIGGGAVRTLVGTGLFDFGDRDGTGRRGAAATCPSAWPTHDGGCSSPTPTTARSSAWIPHTRQVTTWLGGDTRAARRRPRGGGALQRARGPQRGRRPALSSPTPTTTPSAWWTWTIRRGGHDRGVAWPRLTAARSICRCSRSWPRRCSCG